MTGDAATLARLAAAVALAAAPFAWTARHRGARRHRDRERLLDGVLLLGALLLAAMALVLAAVAATRVVRERRERATWPAVAATVDRCVVSMGRSAGRDGGVVFALGCAVRYRVADHEYARTVTAGYLARRDAYDAWVERHPPGTAIALRHDPVEPGHVAGLEDLASATTSASGAAASSLTFALVGCVLLLASRLAARYRGGRAPPPGPPVPGDRSAR